MSIEITAKRLEALGNSSRLEIFRLLVKAGRDGVPVGTVQERTGIARSTLSHHLHRLIAVGLVTQERQGTVLICRADYDVMDETVGFLVSECCIGTGGR
ncbi:metalloregulator ArsR/SmtB family transcription factor [Limibacillus sp. MBR-115]|mgnify:CR=1 FL=1|jgi:DNA-binding transcriptional ArsR family regulator|uniref:ArsR/SmtB family transcription factor n=1 Tax=Limibacillus sp. MBR-115 TaxID=3156465 RepID=UPI0033931925